MKRFFCKHTFKKVGTHKIVSAELYLCTKCGVFHVHHIGINANYNCNHINDDEWRWVK